MEKAINQVQSEQMSTCKEQGGAVIEGHGGDPHAKHEECRPETGHRSAKSPGTKGNGTVGGKGGY